MPDVRYPKKWQEMSLDLKLMFGYHIYMMAMMMAGGAVTVIVAAADLVLSVVLVAVSVTVAGEGTEAGAV